MQCMRKVFVMVRGRLLHHLTPLALLATLGALVLAGACLPKPMSESGGGTNITLYGVSIMKDSLEQAIYTAFTAKWTKDHGQDVHFTASFAGPDHGRKQLLQPDNAPGASPSLE